MNISITHEAKRKLDFYIDECDIELSGFGAVQHEEGSADFLVTDIYLFHQECSGASTDIEAKTVSEMLIKADELGLNIEALKFWWHSHVNMSAFFSGTDVTTASSFNTRFKHGGGWMISYVGNKRNQYQMRLDVYEPCQMVVDKLTLTVVETYPEEYKKYRKELDKKLREFEADQHKKLAEKFKLETDEAVREAIKAEVKEKVKKKTYHNTGVTVWQGNGQWHNSSEFHARYTDKGICGEVYNKCKCRGFTVHFPDGFVRESEKNNKVLNSSKDSALTFGRSDAHFGLAGLCANCGESLAQCACIDNPPDDADKDPMINGLPAGVWNSMSKNSRKKWKQWLEQNEKAEQNYWKGGE